MSTTDDTMSVKSESMEGRDYKKYLTESQIDAVNKAQRIVANVGGCNILGKVGCGKTATAIAVCQEFALLSGKRKIALWLVPKMGCAVFNQTNYEAEKIGLNGNVYIWKDNNIGELKAFLAEQRALETPGISAVITNIQRMDAEVSRLLVARNASSVSGKRKRVSAKKFSMEERSEARQSLFREILGKFDCLWIDEYQNFAAASPSNDANVEVNFQLTQYPIIDHFVRYNRPSCIIGTTATPFLKHPNDIWAFIRLFASNRMEKRQIMTSAKYGTIEERKEFKKTCKMVVDDLTVVLKHDVTPASTKLNHPHTLSEREVACHDSNYQELTKAAIAFRRAMMNMPSHPSHHHRVHLELCKNRFYTTIMLCKRGACHPGLFEPRPMPKAAEEFRENVRQWIEKKDAKKASNDSDGSDDEFVEEQEDEEDSQRKTKRKEMDIEDRISSIVRATDKKFNHTREELVTWRNKLKERWPLDDCQKFKKIIGRLAEITDERSLIMFEHTDTIELLKLYITEAFPEREVYIYHAGLSDNVRLSTLDSFKQTSSNDAILLSTRGSLKQAVNVECTTLKTVTGEDSLQIERKFAVRMLFGDYAESPPDQDQAEGRCKRPKAQGYPNSPDRVQDWFVEFFYSTEYEKPTIETVLDKMSTVKALRCANILTDKSESEDQEAIGENTDEGNKKIINTLLETLSEHAKPETKKRPAEKAEESQKRKRV